MFRTRLEAILAQPGILDPAPRPRATGLVGEVARHAGDDRAAAAALGLTDEATALAATLDTRFRSNLSLGLTAHAREEICVSSTLQATLPWR